MGWRELLSVDPASLYDSASPCTKYSEISKTGRAPISEVFEVFEQGNQKTESRLLEVLGNACRGLALSATDARKALAPEDVESWRAGEIGETELAAFCSLLYQRREMADGKRPDHYTERATCSGCGPVWLWFAGEVRGCPWCRNRLAGRPIPRPEAVRCEDCAHYRRTDHPHLGHCAKGEPEAAAGLWDSDGRYCERFEPPAPGARD